MRNDAAGGRKEKLPADGSESRPYLPVILPQGSRVLFLSGCGGPISDEAVSSHNYISLGRTRPSNGCPEANIRGTSPGALEQSHPCQTSIAPCAAFVSLRAPASGLLSARWHAQLRPLGRSRSTQLTIFDKLRGIGPVANDEVVGKRDLMHDRDRGHRQPIVVHQRNDFLRLKAPVRDE